MIEDEAPEGLPSLCVDFRVFSRDSTPLEEVARAQGSSVSYSKHGIASSSLIEMRIENVSQKEFERVLVDFTQELPKALNLLGGLDGIRTMDVSEVRITVFSNSNFNAGIYVPRDLLELILAYELTLYFDAL